MAATQPSVSSALRLPCGLVLKNRLVKSAMSEKMAIDCQPSADHERLYRRWALGSWAALVTGNIMVDDRYLGGKGDIAVTGNSSANLERWSAWVAAADGHDCHMIAQLNHPGRQSPAGAGRRSFFAKTLAPSAIPLNLGDNWIAFIARAIIFGTPHAMTLAEIEQVIAQFAIAARLAFKAGFKGVEVHAAHGFLLSQFMSSSSNMRTDDFGGSTDKRVELALRVIRAIRDEVPKSFCIGVKVNTADHMNREGFSDMMRQIELLSREEIDYINLSGGSFEDPQMMLGKSHTEAATTDRSPPMNTREAFFLRASQEIHAKFPGLTLILTGGFRSSRSIESAITTGACAAVGIGRPAVKYPEIPQNMTGYESKYNEQCSFDVEAAPSPGWIATKIRSVGAGAETKYWSSKLKQL